MTEKECLIGHLKPITIKVFPPKKEWRLPFLVMGVCLLPKDAEALYSHLFRFRGVSDRFGLHVGKRVLVDENLEDLLLPLFTSRIYCLNQPMLVLCGSEEFRVPDAAVGVADICRFRSLRTTFSVPKLRNLVQVVLYGHEIESEQTVKRRARRIEARLKKEGIVLNQKAKRTCPTN